MNEPAPIEIAMRIPGKWAHPGELIEQLPKGFTLAEDMLTMPDGTEIGFGEVPADKQFAEIFRTSCRQPATKEELAIVNGYTVNVFLMAPGGSLPRAQKGMEAGAAIMRAGGAGVFIDNCVLAHGREQWYSMTEDGSSDALSFAFVNIVRGKTDVRTMGMHVLGLCDVVMKRADAECDDFGIVDVIRYLARGEKPVGDKHVLCDLVGPRFQAIKQTVSERPGTPLHNPFGRLKLVSMQDIAETN